MDNSLNSSFVWPNTQSDDSFKHLFISDLPQYFHWLNVSNNWHLTNCMLSISVFFLSYLGLYTRLAVTSYFTNSSLMYSCWLFLIFYWSRMVSIELLWYAIIKVLLFFLIIFKNILCYGNNFDLNCCIIFYIQSYFCRPLEVLNCQKCSTHDEV